MVNIVRISIKRSFVPESDPFTDFCRLSGVCSSLDRQNIAMKILQLLYKYESLNSTDLSKLTGMSRGAILNHLENLMESGFVFKYGKEYFLREKSFEKIVDLIEKDLLRTVTKMKQYAKLIDTALEEEM